MPTFKQNGGRIAHALVTLKRLKPEATVSFLRVAVRRFTIAGELFSFLWGNKRWWLFPMVFVLFLFGALLILAQSSAIAPFIYTLF